jgi:DNA-binding CsgD family transcriptional regulator
MAAPRAACQDRFGLRGGRSVETVLDFALQLFRAAQDVPMGEFQDAALAALKALVPFRAAVWFSAEMRRDGIRFHGIHLHDLPASALDDFVTISMQAPQAFVAAAASPGRAHSLFAPVLYPVPGAEVALRFARQHRQERQLLVADVAAPAARGEWLSLYRPQTHAPFDLRDQRRLSLLMPHLTQALAMNRSLHLQGGHRAPQAAVRAGYRAVARLDGALLHCGERFAQLIGMAWPDWTGIRLPGELLQRVSQGGLVQPDGVNWCVCARRLADVLLLTVRPAAAIDRLSPRELCVAQLFGAGGSYKDVARRISLAPATVRNVVQNAYRKLGVNSKVQLARLLAEQE